MKMREHFVFWPTIQPEAEMYNIVLSWLWGTAWNHIASWTPGDSLLLQSHYEISTQLQAADCVIEASYQLAMLCSDVRGSLNNNNNFQ